MDGFNKFVLRLCNTKAHGRFENDLMNMVHCILDYSDLITDDVLTWPNDCIIK